MLSKDARKILHIMRKTLDGEMEFSTMQDRMGWNYEKAKSVGDQLIAQGFAREKQSRAMGVVLFSGVVLTEEGRYSRTYFWSKVGSFLFKSIAVPIVVAFLTTLITLWLRGIFS